MSATDSPPRCYFGFRSPYSRLGLHKLARAGFDGEVLAFLGPPDDAGGFADPTANKYKLAYYQHDVFRMTVLMELPLALPDRFDIDWSIPHTAFMAADRAGKGLPFALAGSDARWGQGQDLSDWSVLSECAQEAGFDLPDLDDLRADPDIDTRFAATREAIQADGVFGVPFLIDGHDKFWGQDRFDLWVAGRD